jgi:hypothetical protein
MAETSSTSCSMTCVPRVATRSVKSQRAARSRGFRLADHPAATGQPRQQRRADGPLQVDHRVVLAGPERRAQSLEFLAGLAAEGSFAPLFGGGKMQVVDQRL